MTYGKAGPHYDGAFPRRRPIPGRMKVSGVNVLDENGNPWVMRGFVYGEVDLWNAGDSAVDKALGANCARIMCRTWGGGSYSEPNVDGELSGAWANTLPSYIATIETQIIAAKAAGLKVNLAFDSNCGQNGNQSPSMTTYCTLGAFTGQNFYTPNGATKRAEHITRVRTQVLWAGGLSRACGGAESGRDG